MGDSTHKTMLTESCSSSWLKACTAWRQRGVEQWAREENAVCSKRAQHDGKSVQDGSKEAFLKLGRQLKCL